MKLRTFEMVAVTIMVVGCTSMPWQAQEPAPVATWVDDPRAFAQGVGTGSVRSRERVRADALAEYLHSPAPDEALRLAIVFDASVRDIADAYDASDKLRTVLARGNGLQVESRAVITSILMRTERRIDEKRQVATMGSELAVLQEEYRSLQEDKAGAEAARAEARRALRDAEAKIRALTSIEQTLESDAAPIRADDQAEGER